MVDLTKSDRFSDRKSDRKGGRKSGRVDHFFFFFHDTGQIQLTEHYCQGAHEKWKNKVIVCTVQDKRMKKKLDKVFGQLTSESVN